MKDTVQVSVVQLDIAWLEPDVNRRRMEEFARAEAAAGAELIVFPELANVGYVAPAMPGEPVGVGDQDFAQFAAAYWRAAETVPGPTTDALAAVARAHNVYIVAGLAVRHRVIPGVLHNSAVLIGPEGVVGIHHKVHLPLNEKLYFCPGNRVEPFPTSLGCIGLAVCYDGRFPELPRMLALKGAEIICNIWNITEGFRAVTPSHDSLIHRAYTRAQENGVWYINCSRSGRQGDVRFIGHSAVAAPNGTVVACSQTVEEDVLRVTLRESDLLQYRLSLGIFRDRRPDLYGTLVRDVADLSGVRPPARRRVRRFYHRQGSCIRQRRGEE